MRNRILIVVLVGMSVSAVHAGGELSKVVRPITSADSYSFTVKEGSVGPAVEAKYQKDVPLYCKADNLEFFRKAEVLVYKQGDAWQRTRTGTLSDPLRILGASAKVRAIRLPHDDLTILAKVMPKAKKADAIITGVFNAEAAKKLARSEDRDLARAGSAKFWLDGAGELTKYEIVIHVQGKRGNADVDGMMTRTVTIGAVGKTKVELPAGAKKSLE